MNVPRGQFVIGADPRREEDELDESSDDDEIEDETLVERLWGLTEMFPEKLRTATSTTADYTVWAAKGSFKLTRNFTWMVGTTALIMLFPILFEKERLDMEQVQLNQQRQMLLGPGAAISGGGGAKSGVMGMMPK